MRRNQSARPPRRVRCFLPLIAGLAACGGALAQTALVTTTHTVVAADEPQAVEQTFTIPTAGTYSVTLTDLGAELSPSAPLASVAMAVTQGTALAGTPTSVTAPGTAIKISPTAATTYTVHVVGLPNTTVAGSGPFEVDVTDSSGNIVTDSSGNKLSWIDTLSPPATQPSGVGILSGTFTVSTSEVYTVSMADLYNSTANLQFAAPLENPGLIVVDATTGTVVAMLSAFGSTQTLQALSPGDTYRIVAYAQQSAAPGGLFGVSVGTAGSQVYGGVQPVGSVTLLQTSVSGTEKTSFSLAATGATLTLNNLAFPSVTLASAGAALVDASAQQVVAAVTTTGSVNYSAPSTSDAYQVYAYATPDTTVQEGAYTVTVQQGTAFPFSTAQAVISSSNSSTTSEFNLDIDIPSSGTYALTLTDFGYPDPLSAAALGVIQNGQLVNAISSASNFTATLSQGPATILAFGSEGAPQGQSTVGPGLMGIDLGPSAGGTPVLDVTEGVGAGFSSSSFTTTSAEEVGGTVADLGFPAALQSLNVAVTSGTTLIGDISAPESNGSIPQFMTTANTTYDVTVLAQPAASSSTTSQTEEAGTYAMGMYPSPVVTLSASSSTITSGGTVSLSWTATNATSCTASASPTNSGWTGSESPGGGPVTTAALTATTDFSLSCTGGGGTGSASVTVTVSAASSGGHGGGGSLDPELLLALAAILALRASASRSAAARARSGRP